MLAAEQPILHHLCVKMQWARSDRVGYECLQLQMQSNRATHLDVAHKWPTNAMPHRCSGAASACPPIRCALDPPTLILLASWARPVAGNVRAGGSPLPRLQPSPVFTTTTLPTRSTGPQMRPVVGRTEPGCGPNFALRTWGGLARGVWGWITVGHSSSPPPPPPLPPPVSLTPRAECPFGVLVSLCGRSSPLPTALRIAFPPPVPGQRPAMHGVSTFSDFAHYRVSKIKIGRHRRHLGRVALL